MIEFIEALVGLYVVGDGGDAADGGQEGQGLVEYGLLLLFIAIAVIVALVFFGGKLNTLYSKLGNSIPN